MEELINFNSFFEIIKTFLLIRMFINDVVLKTFYLHSLLEKQIILL